MMQMQDNVYAATYDLKCIWNLFTVGNCVGRNIAIIKKKKKKKSSALSAQKSAKVMQMIIVLKRAASSIVFYSRKRPADN